MLDCGSQKIGEERRFIGGVMMVTGCDVVPTYRLAAVA